MLPYVLLGAWTALTFAVCLLRDRLSPDNLTRLLVIGFLGAALALLPLWRRLARALRPGRWFVSAAVVSALVVYQMMDGRRTRNQIPVTDSSAAPPPGLRG